MRRTVNIVHRARGRNRSLSRRLQLCPTSEWPEHLKLARAILRDELKVSETTTRKLIMGSVFAAQLCAESINSRSGAIIELNLRDKIQRALKRLANCYRRASAKLQKQLDAAISQHFEQEVVDLEVIESILDATMVVFSRFRNEAAAKTALKAVVEEGPDRASNNFLKKNFEGLGPDTQRKCEAALRGLTQKKNSEKAGAVFEVLASALNEKPVQQSNLPTGSTLIRRYTASVKSMWQKVGLSTSWARSQKDPTYNSKFHRYSDLVLTAVFEPWTDRYGNSVESNRQQALKRRAELPRELRPHIKVLRNCDEAGLISKDNVQQLSRRDSKIRV